MKERETHRAILDQKRTILHIKTYGELETADQVRYLLEENLIRDEQNNLGECFKVVETDKLSVEQINTMFMLGIATIDYDVQIYEKPTRFRKD